MKLVMIRHGLTDALEKHQYYGAVDIPLNEKGREELMRFRRDGVYPDLSGCTVYTSGMIRTEQTLELIMGKVDHTVEPRFREMNFGDFELKSYEDLKDRDDYQHWLTDVGRIPCP
ncbi:MAG: histidine phosphatase family protein, partial [Firmicutes bacterium]|nr:histidine phosphatase family protein [Bacillota bacterium]